MELYVDYRLGVLGCVLAHAEDMGLVEVPAFTDTKAFGQAAADAYRIMWKNPDFNVIQRQRFCFSPKWTKNVNKTELLGWLPPDESVPSIVAYYRETKQAIFTHGIIVNFIKRIGGERNLPAYGFSAKDTKVTSEADYERQLTYRCPAYMAGFYLARNIDPVADHDRWCALFWLVVNASDPQAVSYRGKKMKANCLEEIYG